MKKNLVSFSCLLLLCIGCINSAKKNSTNEFDYVNKDSIVGGCKVSEIIENNSIHTIEIPYIVENTSINHGDLFDSIKIVPLETNDESIIGFIDEMEIVNDTIYLLDRWRSKCIKRFGISGKYIDDIGKAGIAPGEYVEPTDISIYNGNIEVLDQYQHYINRYNTQGEFIGSMRVPFRAVQYKRLNDSLSVFNGDGLQNYHIPELMDYATWITDNNFKVIKKAFNYPSSKYYKLRNWNSLQNKGNDFVAYHNCSDTIFTINEVGDLVADIRLEYNRAQRYKNFKNAQDKIDRNKLSQNGEHIELIEFYRNSELTCCSFDGWGKSNYYIQRRDNVIVFNQINNDRTNILIPFVRFIYYGSEYFVSFVDASYISTILKHPEVREKIKDESENTKMLLNNVQAEDNPVLIFHYLKKQ
ncbi:MAG: 6-bladed beta-propeller [Bacteroidales bacterium]|nr:6-bladed beta-propeller [Bacteroidales bacterium]